jgi:para-nitrobenzyl esterase
MRTFPLSCIGVLVAVAWAWGCGGESVTDLGLDHDAVDVVGPLDAASDPGERTDNLEDGFEPDSGDAPHPCPLPSPLPEGGVVTESGVVTGVHGASGEKGWQGFLGIPFAAPPVGDLRWRAPRPFGCWEGVLEAVDFGSPCVQLDLLGTGEPFGDEDCLTLNVWTPEAIEPGDGLPVMVFLHGGGNLVGSANQAVFGVPILGGHHLAARGNVVVVTVQYRLGPFGFLALPELVDETGDSDEPPPGNQGLWDQVASLDWVFRNIAAFGGDPGRVMLFGQSAGAMDACALVTSPVTEGRFHALGLHSGVCLALPGNITAEVGREFVEATACNDQPDRLACLRGMPALDVLNARPGAISIAEPVLGAMAEFRYAPTIDGVLLERDPNEVISEGRSHPMPVLIGSNSDELDQLMGGDWETLDEAGYQRVVGEMLYALPGQVTEDVLAAYPALEYDSPALALASFLSDLRLTCPIARLARDFQAVERPVHRYFFSRRAMQGLLTAFHGAELLFVMGTGWDLFFEDGTHDAQLSDTMLGFWAGTAWDGTPAIGGQEPGWPPMEAGKTGPVLVMDVPLEVVDDVRAQRCELLETIPDTFW